MQEVRERARREEAAELRAGVPKWEVEIRLLQINLCGETAAGRFLLAAQRCQLGGCHLAATGRNATTLDMQARAPARLITPGQVSSDLTCPAWRSCARLASALVTRIVQGCRH